MFIRRHPSHPAANSLSATPIEALPIVPASQGYVNPVTLERRLGHVSTKAIIAGWEANVWDNFKLLFEPDKFCIGCKTAISRTANRGQGKVTSPTKPGQILHMEIHYNPSKIGLSPSSYFPYYLNITNAYSHMCFMIGMQTMKTSSVMEALIYYAQYYKPHLDYTLADIKEFHAGNDFMNCLLSLQCPAVMRTAAPHHQEQNGLAESRWRIVRSRATSMLTHARLSFIFFDSAIVYASYVTNVLPLKGLFTTESDGITTRPATPFELYYGKRPKLTRFRVFGCPDIFKAYARKPNLNDYNILQHGVRGIFVGFPINQAGVLIWVEQVRRFMVSADVHYDEQFTSCLAYNHKLFHDSIPVRQPTYAPINDTIKLANTGPAKVTQDSTPDNIPWGPYTILPMQNPVDVPIISDFHLVDVLNEEGNDGSNSNANSSSINSNDTQLLKTMLGISDADSITVSPTPETDIEPILEEQTFENNDETEINDEIHSITSNEDDGTIEEGYIEAPDQNI
jgi:hypothetical protein